MAIRAHIKHFLNAEGMDFFPVWFEELNKVIRSFVGLITVQAWQDKSDVNCMNIFVDFETTELRSKWAESQLHLDIVSKLDPYRIKPYEVTRYEILAVERRKNLEVIYATIEYF